MFKSIFIPLVVTVEAIQPKIPKYKNRIATSIRGDKVSPKDHTNPGIGNTLIRPKRFKKARMKVNPKRVRLITKMNIPEVSDGLIRNLESLQSTVTIGGCSTITQRPTSSTLW